MIARMTLRRFTPVRPGGQLSAASLNRQADAVREMERSATGRALFGLRGPGGHALILAHHASLWQGWIRLTAEGSGGDYSFVEVIEAGDGGWVDEPGGLAGDATAFPATEVCFTEGVAADAADLTGTLSVRVRAWAKVDNDGVWFEYPFGDDVTFPGDVAVGGSITQNIVTANTSTPVTVMTTTVDSTGTAAPGLGTVTVTRIETSTANTFATALTETVTLTNVTAGSTTSQVSYAVTSNTTNQTFLTATANATTTVSPAVTLPAFVTQAPTTATTNAAVTVYTTGLNSTGTPAAGFGLDKPITLETTTTPDTTAGGEKWTWTDATHATRTSKEEVYVVYQGATQTAYTITGAATLPTMLFNSQVTFPTTGNLSTPPTGYLTLPLVTTTGTPTFTVGEGTPVWNSVDHKLWVSLGGGSFQEIGGGTSELYYSGGDAVTVANTTTETSFGGDGGHNVIDYPKHLRTRYSGYLSTDAAAGTLKFVLKFNGTSVASTGAVTVPNSLSNALWWLEADTATYSGGATANTRTAGMVVITNGTTTQHLPMVNTADVPVDLTGDLVNDVTVEWGTADPQNTITCTNRTLEALG